MLKQRNLAVVILLCLVTCGIYPLIWCFSTMKALDEEGGASNMPYIVQFILLFFYIGYIVFALNADSNLNAIRTKKGLEPKDSKVLYLILGIICPVALIAIVQNDINQIAV